MTLIEANLFSSNWHIGALVVDQLHLHELNGWFDTQERVYMGNTTRLKEIRSAYEQLMPTLPVGSKRLFVRRSCVDPLSNKYTVVGLYLSNKTLENARTVHHATWIAPGRDTDAQIVESVREEFEEFLQQHSFSPPVPQFTEGFSV